MLQRWVLNIAVFMAFLPAVSYAAIPSTNYVNNADHLSGCGHCGLHQAAPGAVHR